VRLVTKKNSSGSKPILREWRVTLMRYRGEFLGNVKATSREAAESEAARLFSLSDFHRRDQTKSPQKKATLLNKATLLEMSQEWLRLAIEADALGATSPLTLFKARV
jgi:hypothetical protein